MSIQKRILIYSTSFFLITLFYIKAGFLNKDTLWWAQAGLGIIAVIATHQIMELFKKD